MNDSIDVGGIELYGVQNSLLLFVELQFGRTANGSIGGDFGVLHHGP
jgi:hypothetical protein